MDYSDGEIIKFEHNFELDDLPFPLWNEMLTEKYKASLLFGNYKTVPIIATRGCPYSCFKYCVYPLQQGRVVRQRNPQKIVDEFEHWKKNFGIKMFIFRDPVFSINRKHTIELCNEIIERKIDVNFIIETHLRILDDELVAILKKAGLQGVKVGIESSNTDVLKNADRFTVTTDVQKKKNEIEQSLYFIQEELSKANLSDIKFSLNELIKSQLRENVFANVKKEYSFRFIDHAIPPIKKSSPNRLIIILIGTILSFAITIFYLVIRLITKDNKKINIFTTD